MKKKELVKELSSLNPKELRKVITRTLHNVKDLKSYKDTEILYAEATAPTIYLHGFLTSEPAKIAVASAILEVER